MSVDQHRDGGRVEYPVSDHWDLPPDSGRPGNRRTMWASRFWIAGIVLIMIGRYGAVEGLTALFKRNHAAAGPEIVFGVDPSGWDWPQLVVGAAVAISGLALFTGAAWVRWFTVALAMVNTIAQAVLATVYPVWSVIVIALCVVAVVWAIIARRDEGALGG